MDRKDMEKTIQEQAVALAKLEQKFDDFSSFVKSNLKQILGHVKKTNGKIADAQMEIHQINVAGSEHSRLLARRTKNAFVVVFSVLFVMILHTVAKDPASMGAFFRAVF